MIPQTMTRDEVRDVDRRAIDEYGLPGIVLMENAGRGCVDWLKELSVSGHVVVCAGKGNNGGDGFVIARHLGNLGIDVETILFCDPTTLRGDAAINFRVLDRSGGRIRTCKTTSEIDAACSSFANADLIIDALLGTGTQGTLREPFPQIINAINLADVKVFSIDLPSGLDCDSGRPVDSEKSIVVRADWTATFVARKQAFDNPESKRYTGEIRVIDIGVPLSMFD